MHGNSIAKELPTIERTGRPADLVLERMPNGELAWLRPGEEEPRFVITDTGRSALVEHEQEAAARAAAMALIFGTEGAS